jgi:hypothetical protein
MQYISGIPALNLTCNLKTDGDWHHSAIDWETAFIWETDESPLGQRGIYERDVPTKGKMPVANHIRAIADLLDKGFYGPAQGAREDFINNEDLTPLVFDMVWMLRGNKNWVGIDTFMGKEYGCDWLVFKERQSIYE